MNGLLVFLGVSMGGLFSLVLTFFAIREIWLRSQFRKIFRFRSTHESALKRPEQALVDQRMKFLAEQMDTSFRSQNAAVERASRSLVPPDELQERATSLRSIAKNAKMYKKAFWRAHLIARLSGYDVRKKYSDYLPSAA